MLMRMWIVGNNGEPSVVFRRNGMEESVIWFMGPSSWTLKWVPGLSFEQWLK